MFKPGALITISKFCIDEYIAELEKNGVTAIHRPDLTKGNKTKLEVTEVKPYQGETYMQRKERLNGERISKSN